MRIRIQHQPITFPGEPTWLPPMSLRLLETVGGFSVQRDDGQFLSVEPSGNFAWAPSVRGDYEKFTLRDGFLVAAYTFDGIPVNHRIPYTAL